MINELLLEKGLARVVIFPPNTEFVDQFRDIEAQAKKEHKGYGVSKTNPVSCEAVFKGVM
ncbi:thermonuclease family protein [Bacillus sp. FSL R5-0418]|uniref:thermonuclease family protein n=1 Tax=Bacillus sp. FSL R5-0418 TaxID=2975300 RepID=UPI0030F72C09